MFSETPSYQPHGRTITLPKAANDNSLSPADYLSRMAERSRMTQMFFRQTEQRLREIRSLFPGKGSDA